MAPTLSTPRLLLRGWQLDDAPAALEIYGKTDVARWLSPAMDRISDLDAMRNLLQRWIDEDAHLSAPAGRWAMQDTSDGSVIGGVILLPLPPGEDDLEIGWQLRPDMWGRGYATEATHGGNPRMSALSSLVCPRNLFTSNFTVLVVAPWRMRELDVRVTSAASGMSSPAA